MRKQKYCTYFAVTFELIRNTFGLFTYSDFALKIHGRFSSLNKYVKRNLFFNSRYRRLVRVECKSIVRVPLWIFFRAAVDLCTGIVTCLNRQLSPTRFDSDGDEWRDVEVVIK